MTPQETLAGVLTMLEAFGAPDPDLLQREKVAAWDTTGPFVQAFAFVSQNILIVGFEPRAQRCMRRIKLPCETWAVETAALLLAGPLGCLDTYAEKKIGDLVRAEMAAMDPAFVTELLSMGDADV